MKQKNPNGYSSYFLSNHDQDRISKSLNEMQNKCAASMLCLMPGTPFMYYGEEIMLQGVRKKEHMTDALRRLPMVWSKSDKTGECKYPENSTKSLWDGTQVKKGVNDQLKDGYSLVNHYKKATNIRNKYPFLKQGVFTNITNLTDPDGVVAYRIALDSNYIDVYHNFSEETVKINVKDTSILDEINTSKKAPKLSDGVLTLAPYSSVILQ